MNKEVIMNELIVTNNNGHPELASTLRDIAAVIFRHKRVLTLSFCGVLLGAIACAFLLPAKYQAETKLLIQRERVDAVVTPGENMPLMFHDSVAEEELNSEIELIKSEDVLREVVVTCGLDTKKNLLTMLRLAGSPQERTAKAVRKLRSDLQVESVKKTNIIGVTYSNKDPKLAAKVLSTLDRVYLNKHVSVERPAGRYQFFEQETEQYKRDLEVAEARLKSFSAEQHGVAPVVLRDLTLQKLTDFNGILSATRASLLETQKRIQQLQQQAAATPARMTTQLRNTDNAQVLQSLKTTLVSLEIKRTELLTKYQPDYPLVKEADKELADTRDALAKEEAQPLHEETTDQNPTYSWIDSELAKAKADFVGLQARETATQAIVNLYAANARDLEEKGITQQDLVRAQKTSEENYLLYLKKREEARIADALDETKILNVAIAQQPLVPTLPTRSPWLFGLLGCVLAAVSSVGTVFTVDYMDRSFRTPSEIAAELKIPVLAAVPRHGLGRNGNGASRGYQTNGNSDRNGASTDGAAGDSPTAAPQSNQQ